jgi:hypothetical protein
MFEAREQLRKEARELYREQRAFESMNPFCGGSLVPSKTYQAQQRRVQRLTDNLYAKTRTFHAFTSLSLQRPRIASI